MFVLSKIFQIKKKRNSNISFCNYTNFGQYERTLVTFI